MKAVYFTEHGSIEKVTCGELADVVPGPDEVLVRVRACGLNHADRWVRQGLPMLRVPLPFTPGKDISGEVVAVGLTADVSPVWTRVVNPGEGGASAACPAGTICAPGVVWAERTSPAATRRS